MLCSMYFSWTCFRQNIISTVSRPARNWHRASGNNPRASGNYPSVCLEIRESVKQHLGGDFPGWREVKYLCNRHKVFGHLSWIQSPVAILSGPGVSELFQTVFMMVWRDWMSLFHPDCSDHRAERSFLSLRLETSDAKSWSGWHVTEP